MLQLLRRLYAISTRELKAHLAELA